MMSSLLDISSQTWHRQVCDVVRFDMLDDCSVCAFDHLWDSEFAAEVGVEVTGRDFVGVGDDAQYVFATCHSIHIWTAVCHSPYSPGASDQCPSLFYN